MSAVMAEEQAGLFDQEHVERLPADVVTLGPRGFLAETFVLEALQLDRRAVWELHGEVLGCPRDYQRLAGGYVYTREGIERLAAHFARKITVRDFVAARVGPEERAAFWWQEGNR